MKYTKEEVQKIVRKKLIGMYGIGLIEIVDNAVQDTVEALYPLMEEEWQEGWSAGNLQAQG